MEAVSPGGVGNHSRRESTWNIPSTEIKRNRRKFSKIMKVGNNIKKESKGMYALDAIELSHAEMIQDVKWRRCMWNGADYETMYAGVIWPYREHQEVCAEAMQLCAEAVQMG